MELLWPRIPALLSLMFVELLWTRPVHRETPPRPQEVELAEEYLRSFYHLHSTDGSQGPRRRARSAPSAVEEKIRQMQDFFGLPQTGRVDPPTLEVMRRPRCGVPDVENFSFYSGKPRWRSSAITYTIAKYTPDMRREEVERSVRSALKMWSDATPLRFIKVDRGRADVVLTFARRTHGDFFPFDGAGGVLAHAFQPGDGLGGDVHFDEDETWTAGNRGYSLFAVAAHELGHSLGLTHSRDPSAVMFPNYRRGSSSQFSLSRDDMLGIQTLYGKPSSAAKAPPPPPPLKKCDPEFSLDAAAVIGGQVVFFKDRQVWVRTARSRLMESTSRTLLPGLSARVDAACDIPAKGVAYIFTGHKYWVVQRLKMKSRAGSIYEFGFPSRVRQLDAAVHENGKTYFFVGEFYYRFDERRRKMDPGFPRLIQKDWPGIPRGVGAAFKLNGSIFFISGTKSYQYDLRRRRVVKTSAANTWLGC